MHADSDETDVERALTDSPRSHHRACILPWLSPSLYLLHLTYSFLRYHGTHTSKVDQTCFVAMTAVWSDQPRSGSYRFFRRSYHLSLRHAGELPSSHLQAVSLKLYDVFNSSMTLAKDRS